MPYDPNNPKDNPNYTDAQRARYAANPTSQFWDKYNNTEKSFQAKDVLTPAVSGFNRFLGGFANPVRTLTEPFGVKNNRFVNLADSVNPFATAGRGIQNLQPGNFNPAYAALQIGSALSFGAGTKGAKAALPFLTRLPKPVRWAATGAELLGGMLVDEPKSKPQTASSVLPGRSYTLTPEQARIIAEANRPENRTDAAGNTGMGGRRTVGFPYPEIVIPTQLPQETPGMQPIPTVVEPAAPPAPVAPGLLPLTPEQLAQIGEERTAAEKAYEDLINMYKLQEEQGRQGYVSDVQSARRQAAGSAVDVGSSLMGTGLGDSPAAAFGAGQMVEGTRQARETADIKTLNQLLSQLTTGRTQAKSTKEANMVAINRMLNNYRIQNTLASQQAAYGNMGGL